MTEDNRDYRDAYVCREPKSHWLRTLGYILATLLGAFLAFYFVTDMALNRITDPSYQMRKMEKFMKQEHKRMERMEQRMGDNPFEPKLAPMLVNLVKESDEYKVIVDLKPLDNNEQNVNVRLTDNVLTVSGEVDKRERNRENIMNFSQAYYLDEKVDSSRMTKERKGNKYIVTIPFID